METPSLKAALKNLHDGCEVLLTANDVDALRAVNWAMLTVHGLCRVCVRVVNVFGFEAEVVATVAAE